MCVRVAGHVEDHYAHSINYMHWGAPKTWYGVPGAQADAFEEVMRAAVPDLIESEKGLLYKMVTMVPPAEAVRAGVDVCHLVQRPGTFVITWPRAYHAGFSHGVNCAERYMHVHARASAGHAHHQPSRPNRHATRRMVYGECRPATVH